MTEGWGAVMVILALAASSGVEPRPEGRFLVYDVFQLGDDGCWLKLGTDLNQTLAELCTRALPDLQQAKEDTRRSREVGGVLRCIAALGSAKQGCSADLPKKLRDYHSLHLDGVCSNLNMSGVQLPKELGDWREYVVNVLSNPDNCSRICRSSENPSEVDYLCAVAAEGLNSHLSAPSNNSSVNVSVTPVGKETPKSTPNGKHNSLPVDEIRNFLTEASPKTQASNDSTSKVPSVTEVREHAVTNNRVEADTVLKTSSLEHEGSVSEGRGVATDLGQEASLGGPPESNIQSIPDSDHLDDNNLVDENRPDDDTMDRNDSGDIGYIENDPAQAESRLAGGLEVKEERKVAMTGKMISQFDPQDYRTQEDSTFFFYFIFILVMSAFGYMAFHNKNKLIALVVEGRRSRSRSRSGGRHSSTSYSKLHSNLEETMTSTSPPSSAHVLY